MRNFHFYNILHKYIPDKKKTHLNTRFNNNYNKVLNKFTIVLWIYFFQADPPDVSRIPVNDALGVTVVLLTCSYRGHEFVRVGYFINNEYTDMELRENPPTQPLFEKVQRNILGDKPRVTRFKINWDDGVNSTSTNVSDDIVEQSMEEITQDAPTSTLGFTENTQNSMEVM